MPLISKVNIDSTSFKNKVIIYSLLLVIRGVIYMMLYLWNYISNRDMQQEICSTSYALYFILYFVFYAVCELIPIWISMEFLKPATQ